LPFPFIDGPEKIQDETINRIRINEVRIDSFCFIVS